MNMSDWAIVIKWTVIGWTNERSNERSLPSAV